MIRSKTRLLALATGIVLVSAAPALEAAAQIRGAGRASIARPAAGLHPGGMHPAGGGGAVRPGGGGGGIANSGNRINTGDININTGGDDHWHDWDDHPHPIAAGVAFGTAAAVTSAVVGSMIYSLPPACSPYAGIYYACGGVYYEPRYEGDTVVYVVVDQPG